MRNTTALRKVAAVLLAAPDERHYGYPLSRAADVRSGVLYPMLARLERAGWLASEWEDPDPQQPGRPRRRRYLITPEGRAALASLIEAQR